jgi:hypothetical protein
MPTTTFSGWNALSKTEMPGKWTVDVDVINEFFNASADEGRLRELMTARARIAADQGRKLRITYSPFYFGIVWRTFADVMQLLAPSDSVRSAWAKKPEGTAQIVNDLGKALEIESDVKKGVYHDVSARLPANFRLETNNGKRGLVAVEVICPSPLNPKTEIGLIAFKVMGRKRAGEHYFGAKSEDESPEMKELARKLRGEPAPEHEQAPALAPARFR